MTELKKCIISNWLALSVENLAEDADDDFFSRVLHNENRVFTHAVTRTKRPWLCDADAMNVGYSYV